MTFSKIMPGPKVASIIKKDEKKAKGDQMPKR